MCRYIPNCSKVNTWESFAWLRLSYWFHDCQTTRLKSFGLIDGMAASKGFQTILLLCWETRNQVVRSLEFTAWYKYLSSPSIFDISFILPMNRWGCFKCGLPHHLHVVEFVMGVWLWTVIAYSSNLEKVINLVGQQVFFEFGFTQVLIFRSSKILEWICRFSFVRQR